METNRLSKIISKAGICSRRRAEELIFKGDVLVNGERVLIPQTPVDPSRDRIVVRGQELKLTDTLHYFILNKPVGFVCSSISEPGNPSVLKLFSKIPDRLFTVGRLDKDTTGLLLVTNDGDFSNKVIHPNSNIEKEYFARANKEITEAHIRKISKGTTIKGDFVRPDSVRKLKKETLSIVISEGKNREVRRLLAAAGLITLELSRLRIGKLFVKGLKVGHYRELSKREMSLIFS